jgi:hypothetical protein
MAGMTDVGNHGGASDEETRSVLLMVSPKGVVCGGGEHPPGALRDTVQQVRISLNVSRVGGGMHTAHKCDAV